MLQRFSNFGVPQNTLTAHTSNAEFKISVTLGNYKFKNVYFKVLTLTCPKHPQITKFPQQKHKQKNTKQSSFRCATRHYPDPPLASI
jgi:hypothetical protein